MAVIVFPIVLHTPFVRFHVPPLVVLVPAVLPGLAQLVTRMLGLLAVPTVVLDRLVNVVIGPFRAMLAFRLIRANIRRARQKQKACESRQRYEQLCQLQNSQPPFDLHPLLSYQRG
jgi:hypothetical protein